MARSRLEGYRIRVGCVENVASHLYYFALAEPPNHDLEYSLSAKEALLCTVLLVLSNHFPVSLLSPELYILVRAVSNSIE